MERIDSMSELGLSPFKKNKQGLYEVPRYRIIQSTVSDKWYIWDRKENDIHYDRYDTAAYFVSKEFAQSYCWLNEMHYDGE